MRAYVTLGFGVLFLSWLGAGAFSLAGFFWVAAVIGMLGLVALAVARPRIHHRSVPKMLPVTLLLITVAVLLPPVSGGSAAMLALWWAGAVLATVAATLLSFDELLSALSWATRLMLLFFWLFSLVALIDTTHDGTLGGNTALRNFALLAFVIGAVQLASRGAHGAGRGWPAVWLVLAAATFMLDCSLGSLSAIVSVVIALGFAQWMRTRPADARRPIYAAGVPVALLGLALLIWLSAPTLGAWWSLWSWLGWLGLTPMLLLLASTWWRAWFLAIDRPQLNATQSLPYATSTLLPLLLLVALSAQTFFTDGLATPAGFALLATLALTTKRLPHTG